MGALSPSPPIPPSESSPVRHGSHFQRELGRSKARKKKRIKFRCALFGNIHERGVKGQMSHVVDTLKMASGGTGPEGMQTSLPCKEFSEFKVTHYRSAIRKFMAAVQRNGGATGSRDSIASHVTK